MMMWYWTTGAGWSYSHSVNNHMVLLLSAYEVLKDTNVNIRVKFIYHLIA